MNASSGKEVYIVGGRIWRSPAAIYFPKYACHVVMLIRAMSQYLIDQIKATTNIENNPAAAVRRDVRSLATILRSLPTLALQLHRQPIDETQLTFLCNLYQQAATTAKHNTHLDPLTQSELEDTV